MNDKEENMVNVMLYILKQIGQVSSAIIIFNILYIADKKHLSKYGRLIAEEGYMATTDSPAPITGLKIMGCLWDKKPKYLSAFIPVAISGLCARIEADMDCISKSEAECMDEAIEEYKIGVKDSAYKATKRGEKMDILKIAEVAGANKAMIEYIRDNN